MKNIGVFSGFVVILLISLFGFQVQDDFPGHLVEKINLYTARYPQEKIYLQTDRAQYYAGDDIWLKIYLSNAETQRPDTLQSLVYVALVNDNQELIAEKRVKVEKGSGQMHFPTDEFAKSGIYTILAYNSWMLNFDETLISKRNIRIYNAIDFQNQVEPPTDNFDIKFYPEGGNLVSGLRNRIAFEALRPDRTQIQITGKVINEQGETVTNFESVHMGMGIFEFTPDLNHQYFAEVNDKNGKSVRVPMPQAVVAPFTMQINNSEKDFILVSILAVRKLEEPQTFWLTAVSRGTIYFMAKAELSGTDVQLNIPKFRLPEGITKLTIFNTEIMPVAERLVFIKKSKEYDVSIKSDTNIYAPRSKTELKVSLKDREGNDVAGNLAATVVDDSQNDFNDPVYGNIYSHFYLTSELPGEFISATEYFDERNPQADFHLDLLMMTRGWRRYEWKKILEDQNTLLREYESGITINGVVTDENYKPFRKKPVFLLIGGDRSDFLSFYPDKLGQFSLPNLDITDSTKLYFQVAGRGSTFTKFYLDTVYYLPRLQLPIIDGAAWQVDNFGSIYGLGKRRFDIDQAFDTMRVKILDEVTLESTPIEAKEWRKRGQIYGVPSNRFDMDKYPNTNNYRNVYEFLRGRVPGMQVLGSSYNPRIYIRDIEVPWILIDGSLFPISVGTNIPISNIETVDVVRGNNIYSEGGLIAVYTKQGAAAGTTTFLTETNYPGFSLTREFYSPVYGPEANSASKPDFRATIHWEPNIILNGAEPATVEYYNSDNLTSVTVLVEGFTERGFPVSSYYHYRIKND